MLQFVHSLSKGQLSSWFEKSSFLLVRIYLIFWAAWASEVLVIPKNLHAWKIPSEPALAFATLTEPKPKGVKFNKYKVNCPGH